MVLILGLAIVLGLAAVLPVPVIHQVLAWVGEHLGAAVNHAVTQGLTLATHGHATPWSQAVASAAAVIGLCGAVIILAVVSTARAATRAICTILAILALVAGGVYAPHTGARTTLWVTAGVLALVFVGVVVLGRLVAVVATIVAGTSALSALLDIHSATATHSADQLATLSRFHDPWAWSIVLVAIGAVELLAAGRILVRGRVLSRPSPPSA